MSDGGTWQPPDPGAAVPMAEPPAPPSRSRGKVIGATVGALAIVGAGVFAVTRIAGVDGEGGAATPEDAGRAFVEAIGNEDLLGIVDVTLPGERQALRGPLSELVDELRRLEVLSEEADASAISGVDLVVESVGVDAEETNVDDIVNLSIRAAISGSINGEELPVGDWIRDELGDELNELDEAAEDAETESIGLTAVEDDGRWYVSLFHTIAESARRDAGEADIPEEGVTPDGGDSPEAAMDALFDAVEGLDLEAMIAALDPDEMQALQRYAPLFLDDAQAELDTSPLEMSITDRSYTIEGSGDRRSVTLDAVAVEMRSEGETVSIELVDGCWIAKLPDGEETNSCEPVDEAAALDEMFDDPEAIEQLLNDVREALADYENPGFVVREVDGSWYLSPIGTATEQLLAVVRSLTREELEGLRDGVDDVIATIEDVAAPQVPVTPETGSEPVAPADVCWVESEAAAAASCFDALIADGEIDQSDAPWYLRYSECGLAEIGWSGEYYNLPDAEFVAAVEDAAPCFQALVDSGEADELELPIEVLRPDCLFGRNWYTTTDDDYLKEFEDCAFG